MDKNKKILIVENDINTQTIYVGMLSSFGYGNVKTFCCGNDVLEYLDDNDADLIIMDIILSDEMDGVVVAQNIRKFSDIPIIFIMGTEADEFVQRAKTTDPSGYLIKPFKMEEMKTIIEIVFEKHGMQKELKKQKRLFDSILSSISEIVIVTDKDFSIIFYNDSAKQDLFYTDFIQNFLDIGLKSVENDEQFCQSMISNRYAKEYYIGEGNNKKFYEMSFKNIEIQTIEYNLITLHHITEKKNLQYNIEAQANILKKQNRELNFIISLSELIEKPGITISGMMTGIIKLLISVLSYTENAYGEIIVSGRVYSSHPIKKTLNHSRTLMIYAFGQVKGKLVFGYQSDNSNVDFENLLDDEMQLINSVLENIQKSIERRIFHSNLSKTLSFERAIYEMSSRLISEDFDLINDGVIKDLGTLLNSKSINLILFNDKEFKIDKYHSWSKNDVESENVVDFKRNFNEYKWVIDRLRNNKFVKWFSYDDIPFEAIKEKEFFKNIDFTSIIMFPIFIRKEFRGVIAFWGVKEGRKWKNNFLTLLHMFCDNIANNLETREYQQTINNQLEFQKTLVDTVPNPIYYKNKEGQFTGWNKEFEKFCNKPAAEISNKSGVEIFGSEYGKQLNDYELNLLKNAGVIRYEHIFKENFSKPRNVIISKASYFSGNGEVAGVVGSIIDITAQKNAEKEIASANERNELIIWFQK